jgi:MoxR-like ATPase
MSELLSRRFATEVAAAEALRASWAKLRTEVSTVIVGQQEVVDHVLLALLCRGHALLVGVPGLAKTLLIHTIAQTLRLDFSRIQFTPDLMPSDILGTEILDLDADTGRKAFKFVRGPVFANVLLADEINRTPPKTQSALLEAMQERRVTVAGATHRLPDPFFVLATQNPIEQEGTYPLPEAQLDRFMFDLRVGYPTPAEEALIVQRTTGRESAHVSPVLEADDLLAYQELVRRVEVAPNVVEYAVRLVGATRPSGEKGDKGSIGELISWGAGPRASQYLILAAKANSLVQGRYSPDIDDVRAMALPVLRHRILPSFTAEADGITADAIIERLLGQVRA